jgi:hypothetical protein
MSGFWRAGAATPTEMLTTAGVTLRSNGARVGMPSLLGSGKVAAPAATGSRIQAAIRARANPGLILIVVSLAGVIRERCLR